MKSFFLIFMVFSLSSFEVAILTTTAVSIAVKVVEVPFNAVGSVFSDEEEETEKEQ